MEGCNTQTGLVRSTPKEFVFLKSQERKRQFQEEWKRYSERIREENNVRRQRWKKLRKGSPEEFYKEVFLHLFGNASKSLFRLSYDDIREFGEGQVMALEEMVYAKIWRRVFLCLGFLAFVPIFWAGLFAAGAIYYLNVKGGNITDSDWLTYLYCRRKLKKARYSPAHVLMERLKLRKSEFGE